MIPTLGEHTQVEDARHAQPVLAKPHLAQGNTGVANDSLTVAGDEAIRWRVAGFFLLQLKLGQRRAAENLHEELVDRQMITDPGSVPVQYVTLWMPVAEPLPLPL